MSAWRNMVVILGLMAVPSAWAEELPWQTLATGKLLIKMRNVPNSHAKEFFAEGDMDVPVQDIQNTLMDHENFPHFMPYMKESKTLGAPLPDGGQNVYARLEFPLVASRDYVVRAYLVESVREDGTGNFRNKWHAVNDLIPPRQNVVRVTVNEGTWYATPLGDGSKSRVVYNFRSETGGWVPDFILSLANKTGVTDTFNAVEKESKRRHLTRLAASKR